MDQDHLQTAAELIAKCQVYPPRFHPPDVADDLVLALHLVPMAMTYRIAGNFREHKFSRITNKQTKRKQFAIFNFAT